MKNALALIRKENYDKLSAITCSKKIIGIGDTDSHFFDSFLNIENKISFEKEIVIQKSAALNKATDFALFNLLFISIIAKSTLQETSVDLFIDGEKLRTVDFRINKNWDKQTVSIKLDRLKKINYVDLKIRTNGTLHVRSIDVSTRLDLSASILKDIISELDIAEVFVDRDDFEKKTSEICITTNVNKIDLKKKPPLVSIMTPTYNGLKHITKCAEHIIKNTPVNLYEWLVLDDCSNDGTDIYFRTRFSSRNNISYIKPSNPVRNFSKANNILAEKARGKYLVFLNNDCYVQPNWLETLLARLEEDPLIGVAGSLLLFPNTDRIQHCGVVFVAYEGGPLPGHLFHNEPIESRQSFIYEPRFFQAVTAACAITRKNLFDAVGGMNTQYEFGYEDIDFCLKIRDLGYKILYEPASMAYHEQGGTLDIPEKIAEKTRMFHKNKNIFQSIWSNKPIVDAGIYTHEQQAGLYKTHEKKIKVDYIPVTRGHGHSIYRTDNAVDGLTRTGVNANILDPELINNLADIVLVQRCSDKNLINLIKNKKVRIGYDLDDYIFDQTVAKISNLDQTIVNSAPSYEYFMSQCDFFTTTTKHLASKIQERFKKPTFIIPNAINPNTFKSYSTSSKNKNKIIIGYASGTATHDEDFNSISHAISTILSRHANTVLRIIGYVNIHNNVLDQFKNRIEQINFVRFEAFPTYLQEFDINLAPLAINPFNKAKSPLKYIEAGFLSIPTIASDIDGYKEAIIDGHNGFLCGSSEEWIRKLSLLIDRTDIRTKMGFEAQKDITNRFLTKHTGQLLHRVFESMLAG